MEDRPEQLFQRIEDALYHAHTSNQPVEPAVLAAFQASFPGVIINRKADNCIEIKSLEAEDKQTWDAVTRAMLLRFVREAEASGLPVMKFRYPNATQSSIERYLDMLIAFADLWVGMDAAIIFYVLEDIIDIVTVHECKDVFAYVESKRDVLVRKKFFDRGKTATLRLCNSLLRRLTKSDDMMLCGEILIFLAKYYPLDEKSGVNINASYNTGHHTMAEDVAPGAVDSQREPIDVNLYKTFWGLSNSFQSPATALGTNDGWAKLCADVALVLDAFAVRPITVTASSAASGAAVDGVEQPTPKYLTSPSLFGLQLRDAVFRRNFLVQCLILLHALRHPGKAERDTLKPMQYGQLEELQGKVYAALAATPEEGARFAEAVRTALVMETSWVLWKRDGCKAMERPPGKLLTAPPPTSSMPADKARSERDRLANKRRAEVALESLQETLGSCNDNTYGLKVEDRDGFKGVRAVLDPMIEEMDPEAGVPEQSKQKHKKVYQWSAFRVVAESSLEMLFSINEKPKPTGDGPPPPPVPPLDDASVLEAAARLLFPDVAARYPAPEEVRKAAAAAAAAAAPATSQAAAAAPATTAATTPAPAATPAAATPTAATAPTAAAPTAAAPTAAAPTAAAPAGSSPAPATAANPDVAQTTVGPAAGTAPAQPPVAAAAPNGGTAAGTADGGGGGAGEGAVAEPMQVEEEAQPMQQ